MHTALFNLISKVKELKEKLDAESQQALDAVLAEYEACQASKDLVARAVDIHCSDDIEVDAVTFVSEADEGDWVAGWLWVPHPACDSCHEPVAEGKCPDCYASLESYLMHIETDDDFSIRFRDRLIGGGAINIRLRSVAELDNIEILGPYGTPRTPNTKGTELEDAITFIKQHPDWPFDSTGGNRGVHWIPAKYPGNVSPRWWMNSQTEGETDAEQLLDE